MLARALRLLACVPCWMLLACHAAGQDAPSKDTLARLAIDESEFIFPKQDEDHVHSSSIVELSSGELLAAWFQGSGERNADDVRIMGARKSQGGVWSQPFVLADTPGHPDCNPVLWIDQEKRLWLFWSAILSNEWESSLVKYCVATDYDAKNGPPDWDLQSTLHVKPVDFHQHTLGSWKQLAATLFFVPRAVGAELSVDSLSEVILSEWKLLLTLLVLLAAPLAVHRWRGKTTGRTGWKRLAMRASSLYATSILVALIATAGYLSLQSSDKLNQRLGWLTANKPVQYASGKIVLPLYSDRFGASIMAISEDAGITWKASEPLLGFGNIQPGLLQCNNGELVAWMREGGTRKRVRYSVSTTQGRTWSSVRQSLLPNPGSKIAVAELDSGDWIMAYNPIVEGRHALALAISSDEGQNWRELHLLESASPEQNSYSYPCLIEAADGRVHVTYSYRQRRSGSSFKSIKHVVLRTGNSAPATELGAIDSGKLRQTTCADRRDRSTFTPHPYLN
jgi:predicted neuraminidase